MSDLTSRPSPSMWWREPEVLVLIAIVLIAYFVRLDAVSMRGEEPTRALIAQEMLESGQWLVPTIQGVPLLSRPPLHNWVIAASTALCGTREAWAARLPSALAMLYMTLLIYGYSRTRLTRLGALAAALSFPTMGEMFTTGAQAETDMLFTALVSSSLMLWHWGQLQRWPAWRTWVAGYAFVGLGILCKGPQAPTYFVGGAGIYLLASGQWRQLISFAHLTGILACTIIVLGWMLPCIIVCGWDQTHAIIMHDSSARFAGWLLSSLATHWVVFPLEMLGCTLPWSLFLLAYVLPGMRCDLGPARPGVLFTALCFGLGFVSIWLPPEGRTRYLTPLYPCMSVLIGFVLQRFAEATAGTQLRTSWRWLVQLGTVAMVLVGIAAISASVGFSGHPRWASWTEPLPIAVGGAFVVWSAAWLLWRARRGGDPVAIRRAVLGIALFMVVTCTGMLTNIRIRRSEDQAAAVAQLKRTLPQDARVVSIGPIERLFAYYFESPIRLIPEPVSEETFDDTKIYFCIGRAGDGNIDLPFAWDEVGVVSMDRWHAAAPKRVVVVGHRRR